MAAKRIALDCEQTGQLSSCYSKDFDSAKGCMEARCILVIFCDLLYSLGCPLYLTSFCQYHIVSSYVGWTISLTGSLVKKTSLSWIPMLGEMRRKHSQWKMTILSLWVFAKHEKGEGRGRKGKENENLRDTLCACEHMWTHLKDSSTLFSS